MERMEPVSQEEHKQWQRWTCDAAGNANLVPVSNIPPERLERTKEVVEAFNARIGRSFAVLLDAAYDMQGCRLEDWRCLAFVEHNPDAVHEFWKLHDKYFADKD